MCLPLTYKYGNMGKRTTQLGEITTIDDNDILYGVDVDDLTHSPDGTSVRFKKSSLLKEVAQGVSDNAGDISDIQGDISDINDQITDIYSAIEQGHTGWNPITAGCTYQGADAPSYSMYIEGNANLFLTLGMRILLTNGGSAKMFILTLIGSYDAGNDRTLLTMYGGTDYTLANSAITDVYFSPHKAPYGFPLSPAKWGGNSIKTGSGGQSNPSSGVWYNLQTFNISIPIGMWKIGYRVPILTARSSAGDLIQLSTLSTGNNNQSDQYWTVRSLVSNTTNIEFNHAKERIVAYTSKTTLYFNGSAGTSGMTALNIQASLNDGRVGILYYESAYL